VRQELACDSATSVHELLAVLWLCVCCAERGCQDPGERLKNSGQTVADSCSAAHQLCDMVAAGCYVRGAAVPAVLRVSEWHTLLPQANPRAIEPRSLNLCTSWAWVAPAAQGLAAWHSARVQHSLC
jgi:hypothetical protein